MANRRLNDGFKHIMEREVLEGILTRCLSKAKLGSATISANRLMVVSDVTYCIDGYMYKLSVAASILMGEGLPLGAGQSGCASGMARMWAACLTKAGSLVLYGGPAVSAGKFVGINNVPLLDVCPVGLVKVSNNATTSFAVGTNAFGSATSVEYFDISVLPQGVIISD